MCALKQHDFDLGTFGAPTQKPIWIYSPYEVDLEFPSHVVHSVPVDDNPTAIVHFGYNNDLIHIASVIQHVPTIISSQLILRYTNAAGERKVQGGPGLKQSQAYPAPFGEAMFNWWHSKREVFSSQGHTGHVFHTVWHCLCVCVFKLCVPVCMTGIHARRSRRVSWLKESSNMDVHVLEARILQYCSSSSCNDCMMSHFAPLFQWCQHVVKH